MKQAKLLLSASCKVNSTSTSTGGYVLSIGKLKRYTIRCPADIGQPPCSMVLHPSRNSSGNGYGTVTPPAVARTNGRKLCTLRSNRFLKI